MTVVYALIVLFGAAFTAVVLHPALGALLLVAAIAAEVADRNARSRRVTEKV